jgi:hypothetical protein
LEGEGRKQISKQIHHIRKQPKPESSEIGIEKFKETALFKIVYNTTPGIQ